MQNTFLDHKLLIFFCISFVSIEMHAQLAFCQGNSGDPIFTETFDTGLQDSSLPAGTTTYIYANGQPPDDGLYTVSSNTNYFDWFDADDHTQGDTNGRMLIVNSSFSAGEFYRTTITGLCEITTYEFSSWLMNLAPANGFCGAGAIPINVRFEIWDDTDTNLLASGTTGNIFGTITPTWDQYALVFQTIVGQTSVILKMINNSSGGCGNDIAIDDIVFKTCGDLIAVEDSSNNNSVTICSSQTPFSETITAIPDNTVFNNHFYQWQESTDGNSWININGETNASISVSGIMTTTYYRAKVAEFATNLSNSDCLTFSDVYEIIVNSDPAVPVSNGDVDFNCTANQAVLSVVSVDGIIVNWYDAAVGGTQLQSNSETYTATTSGVYYAEAFDTATGCVSVTRVAINASAATFPDAPISDGNANLGCNSGTAILSVTVPNGINVNWFDTSNGGNQLETNSTTLDVMSQGTYYAEAIDSNTGCISMNRTAVIANEANLEDGSFEIMPTCDGAIVNITGTLGGTFQFNPIPSDGAIINPATGNVTNGTSGSSYTIEYTTMGVCSVTGIETFSVLPGDDASFTISPTCDGGIPMITGLSGGTFSFNPLPSDGTFLDSTTGVITGGVSGNTYTIEYTTNGICPSTSAQSVTVDSEVTAIPPTALEVCDDGVPDGITAIDLSLKNLEITGNNPDYSVSYYLNQLDAESETSPLPMLYTNTVNGQIIYVRVEDTGTGCYATTTLELVVEQAPIAFEPQPLRYCDPDNDGFGMFTLITANNEITGGASGLTVSYHETLDNANLGVDAIDTALAYNNIEINTQVVYARVESATIATDCATIVELELIVEPTPQLLDPIALEECDDISADGFAQFNLTISGLEALNGQDPSQYIVSYYETEANAELSNNAIANPLAYTNTIPFNQTLWIRVDDNTTIAGCYKLTSLDLIVNPLPVLVMPSPLELCDVNNPGDEQEGFTLEDVNAEILNGQAGITLSYYETQLDAENGTSPITSLYTNTSTVQTIFVRAENNATGCYSTITFTIRVNPIPTPTPSDQLPDLELCDVINTGDGEEVFDLTANEVTILNGELGVTASYHTTSEDAEEGINPILDPVNYTNVESPEQEIYVRITKDVTGCYVVVNFTLIVHPLPEVVAVTDFIQCELNTDGLASFDLSSKDSEVLNGQDPTQFIVSYHDDLLDAESGMNALGSTYTNLINPQQIFVRITNNVTGCFISTQSFNVQVDEAAEANSDMEAIIYQACDDNMETDGNASNDSVQFDLSTRDPEVLDGQDPSSYIVSYYASEVDANQNVNPLPLLYENIVNPQVIYARVDNNTLAVIPITLDITILTTGLDLNADGTIDTYDTDGDGVFDLVDVDGDGVSDAIDTNADGFIDFVDTNGDGIGDAVDLDNDGVFNNQEDGSICFAVASLTLQVNPLPEFDLADSYILCINTNGTEVLSPLVLDTGLSDTDYSFEWSYNGDVLPTETSPSLSPSQGGTYSVTVTDMSTSTVTSCTNTDTTEVIESEPPSLEVNLVTQAFANNHVIEAMATGIGEYEYSLDGGPWQDSGTFSNVSSGNHQVTARDKNGCGIATEPIFVIDYPLYFTPNGDGNHDTWNIAGIGGNAKIYIFDRYGKLLKQLSPTGQGWNGTYNGGMLPTSDYWFKVEYNEPLTGDRKEFKAHFTLKR